MWKVLKRVVNEREIKIMLYWGIAAAVLQGITLALLIPFLRALYAREDATTWLIILTVFGLAAYIVEAFALRHSNKVSVYDVCDTMIQRVADKVLTLPLGWFSAANKANVANVNSTHVNTLSHLGQMLIPQMASAFVTPLVLVVAVAFYDWRLSLIMVVAIWPLWMVWKAMKASITRANEISNEASVGTAVRMVEFAQLQPVLRSTGVAETWEPAHAALKADIDATREGMIIKGRPAQFFVFIVNTVFALVTAAGMAFVLNAQLDPVVYIVIMATVARTTLPLTQASVMAGELNNTGVAAAAVAEILDTPTLPQPVISAKPKSTDIELQDVSFAYDSRPVLGRINLSAPAGQVTALIGPSGSGKTTILRLIARFWDTSAGAVRIGSVNVKDINNEQLMGLISMVFQDVYLFDTTIRENLRIARPEATDEELEIAARRARLDKVIEALPHGWDTEVGPAGLSLSGGERQRVAIARAFIKDAPILLLDEITSALDGENESAITEVISELSRGRTVIVVAHRLSTIRNADVVYMLGVGDEGAYVAESGHPAELLEQAGAFKHFVDASHAVTSWRITS